MCVGSGCCGSLVGLCVDLVRGGLGLFVRCCVATAVGTAVVSVVAGSAVSSASLYSLAPATLGTDVMVLEYASVEMTVKSVVADEGMMSSLADAL